MNPTAAPTRNPTKSPTMNPTAAPTRAPTRSPTESPTSSPTLSPTTMRPTTMTPTVAPTTVVDHCNATCVERYSPHDFCNRYGRSLCNELCKQVCHQYGKIYLYIDELDFLERWVRSFGTVTEKTVNFRPFSPQIRRAP